MPSLTPNPYPLTPIPARVLISGYYGFDNLGDEAVLAGIIRSFKECAGPDFARFTVMSADLDFTRRRHKVEAIDRMAYSEVRKQLRETDLMISGGGSLLQDTSSLKSLMYYLGVMMLARKAGVPVMWYAQGIGPLKRRISRFLVGRVARKMQAISVREPFSAALLETLGVQADRISVTADPAFVLSPLPEVRADAWVGSQGIHSHDRPVVISVRPWRTHADETERFFGSLVEEIATRNMLPVLVPMQPLHDMDVCLRAAKSGGRVLDDPIQADQFIALASRSVAVVGMRLHSMILGAVAGAPLFAVAYDPKVQYLTDTLGLAHRCWDIGGLNSEIARHIADECLVDSADARASLAARTAELRDRALQNVGIAVRLLEGSRKPQ